MFEEGHADSSVSQRTGQRRVESLRPYKHLHGNIGRQQEQDILDGKTVITGSQGQTDIVEELVPKKVRTEETASFPLTLPVDLKTVRTFL